MANIKLGNNTLTGVSTIRLQNADVAGEYVSFGLAAPPAGTYVVSFNVLGSVVGQIAIPQGDPLSKNPYIPTISGYFFLGWSNIDGRISFPYTPTTDETWIADIAEIWCFGVSGMGNQSPTLTRTYDNVGKSYSIDATTGTISTDFDDIFNFETVELAGNTMIKIPKMYKRIDSVTDNQITAFTISNRLNNDFTIYPCFLDEDGLTELDYILVSKGKATGTSSRATCVSGSYALTGLTIAKMRTAARANGTGWQQYDWMVHQLIRDLFCVVFATTNAQSIFKGRVSDGGVKVGATWDITTPCGWSITTLQNRFFGLEDIFGNYWDWCDGIVCSNDSIYFTTVPSKFSESTSNKNYAFSKSVESSALNGFISKLRYCSDQPFFNYPVKTNGNTNTYYCDYKWDGTSGTVLMLGTGSADNFRGGLWAMYGGHTGSSSGNDISGRLVYRPL